MHPVSRKCQARVRIRMHKLLTACIMSAAASQGEAFAHRRVRDRPALERREALRPGRAGFGASLPLRHICVETGSCVPHLQPTGLRSARKMAHCSGSIDLVGRLRRVRPQGDVPLGEVLAPVWVCIVRCRRCSMDARHGAPFRVHSHFRSQRPCGFS